MKKLIKDSQKLIFDLTFLSVFVKNSSMVLNGKVFDGTAKYDIIIASQSHQRSIPAIKIEIQDILDLKVSLRISSPNMIRDLNKKV